MSAIFLIKKLLKSSEVILDGNCCCGRPTNLFIVFQSCFWLPLQFLISSLKYSVFFSSIFSVTEVRASSNLIRDCSVRDFRQARSAFLRSVLNFAIEASNHGFASFTRIVFSIVGKWWSCIWDKEVLKLRTNSSTLWLASIEEKHAVISFFKSSNFLFL